MNFAITNPQNADIRTEAVSDTDGISLYRISVAYREPTVPKPIVFSWKEPMKNQYSVWHPLCGRGRNMPQWFGRQTVNSRFYSGAPILSVLTSKGQNTLTVSLLDTVKPMQMTFDVDDFHQKDEVDFSVTLFSQKTEPLTACETVLRLDRRDIPLYDAVRSVTAWWTETLGLAREIQALSYVPLYSSWYNFHQNPEQTLLTEELRVAADVGFRTVILDDGWQFEGEGTKDYLKSGDWQVAKDKFPDFKKFVEDIHSFGQKLIVWFSVPFAGFMTEAYKTYRNKLLYEMQFPINAGVLDIRYPDVRAFIVNTYLDFIHRYDIDGLKLDFLDCFDLHPDSPAYNDAMDCDTVEKAVFMLLDEIKTKTEAVKPDFLCEFRQTYIGPMVLRYGTMVRVGDCAYDSVTNRIGTIDLRLMTRDIAVHSDMLLWAKDESLPNCGLQLLNILFSVPQISVLLTKSTEAQKALVKNFVGYWTENKETLLDGTLLLSHPEANYSSVTAKKGNRTITVLYAETAYTYDGSVADVWNGSAAETLYISNPTGKAIRVTVTDEQYRVTDTFCTENPLFSYAVPVAGRLHMETEA